MARTTHALGVGVIIALIAVVAAVASIAAYFSRRSRRRETASSASEPATEPSAGRVEPQPEPDRPDPAELSVAEDLAKLYRDQFAKGVATTTLAILGAVATLTVLFVNQIAPMAGTVGEVVAAKWAAHAAAKEWQHVRYQVGIGHSKRKKKAHDIAALRSEENQKAKRKDVRTARTRLEKLKTPLGDLNLPDDAGPLVWSMSLAGVLIYIHRRRLVLTAMALRVVHLHRDRLHKPIGALSGFGAWTPFWLAPLPLVEGDLEDEGIRDGLLRFLGWRSDQARRTRLTVLCLVAIAFTWLFVLVVAIAYARLAEGYTSFWAGGSLLVVPIVAVLAFHIPWGRRILPMGAFPERVDRGVDETARRRFMQAAGVISLGVVGYNVYQAIPRSLRYLAGIRWPRHRRKQRKNALPVRNAIVVNPKSGFLNYVRADGLALGGIQLPAARVAGLKDIINAVWKPREKTSPRLSRLRGPVIIEMVAVELATKGNVDLAIRLVLTYLRETPITAVRLFNLVAALLANERSPQRLEELRMILNEQPDPARAALLQVLLARIEGKASRRHWKNDRFVWKVPYPPRTVAAHTRPKRS
jgi:uncharacterized membrane protein YagU involved in acid resistance